MARQPSPLLIVSVLAVFIPLAVQAQDKARARALGVPFEGTPGPLNAITDVAGVAVGHSTIIQGDSVRTGVTAVLPRGQNGTDPVFAAWFSLNGDGEMTGTTYIEDLGYLHGPVMITNTYSVGVVRDAVIAWCLEQKLFPPDEYCWSLPMVAETWDGHLNDINGFHVKPEHAYEALRSARPGPVPEGNVGGGTGMVCHEFKGGIGSASRRLSQKDGGYSVGVLVQCNYGLRRQLRVAGVPVGREISDHLVYSQETGSIIIVVATDAPLLPHQLKRVAKRAALGLARNGSTSGNGSGDIFVALSTANPGAGGSANAVPLTMLPNDRLNPIFEATVQATEEAIINALVAAETMTGAGGHTVIALPHDRLRQVLEKYSRLAAGR